METANTVTHDKTEWDEYLALLLRSDSPEKRDATKLESAARKLGVSSDAVARDVRLIARARKQMELHADCDRAVAYARECEGAADKLGSLQKVRPEFFDDADPPRLRAVTGG